MSTKSSILVVDDDPNLRKTLFDILKAKAYAPTTAATGKAALDRVEEEMPVVALIDLRLEEMSGLEVMREIKERSPGTECIVLTGYASQSSAIEAVNLGAYSYVQKPYEVGQLLVTIRRAIEKREAEEALRESEEKYRDLVERANDGICIIQDTIVKYANPRLAEMWGGTVEEVIDTPFTDYIYPDELPEVADRYKRRMAGEEVTPIYETILRRKDGSRVHAELNAGRIAYQGKPADLVLVRDITERKRAEEAMERRAIQLALLNDIGGKIAAVLELDSVLDRAAHLVQEGFGYHHVALFILDRKRGELVMRARAGEFALLFPPDHRLNLDQGLVGWVGRHGETLLANDVDAEPRYINLYPDAIPTRSELSVPIRVGEEIMGVLDAQSLQINAFDENDVMVMETLADQIAVAIENARLFQESQRRTEEMAALRKVNLATLSTLERAQVFEVMLDQLGTVIDYDTAAIQVVTPDGRQKMIAGRGPIIHDQAMWDGFDVKDNKLVQEMRETRQPVVVHDTHGDERYEGVGNWEAFHSWVGAPLFVRGDLIGFLAVEKTSPGFFDEKAAQLLADFAHAAAIALENVRLYEDIRRERDYSQTLIATANALVVGLDLEGRITLFNDFCAEITSYSREEVLGRDWFTTLVPERRRLPSKRVFRELVEQGLPSQHESLVLTKDGRERVIAWSNTVIRDAEGRPANVLAIGQDVTKRKRAEEALAAERERLAVTLRSIGDGVVATDAEGRIVLANPRAQEYLALLADAGVGDVLSHLGDQPLGELLRPPPEGETCHEVVLEGPPHRMFEVVAQPMEAGPETSGWVLVLRDVTEEREVQQRIQQQERLAAVGQLAAGIAHDFNNLLTSIVGFAELLRMRADMPESAKRDLARIVGQGQRAAHLIRQILDFSRRSIIQQRPLDLVPFLKEATRFLERTIPESIHIVLEVAPGRYLVNADPTQIQQVLTNLAVNARHAMPTGGELRLRLSRLPLKAGKRAPFPGMRPGEWIALSVSDTGVGISPEVLPHIFEPFFTTREVGEGTGLGLAQVYGIVKQHDGYIDVESQAGKGTTVVIYLPPLAVWEEAPEEKVPTEIPRGHGQTVLLVEDEPEVLETARAMLKHLGYRVLTAANGQQALEVHAEHKHQIALVLSDMVMPKMGGLELYRLLRRRDPAIKMVMVTGYPLGEEAKSPLPRGILGWVEKPFMVENLAQVLHQALEEQGQTRA